MVLSKISNKFHKSQQITKQGNEQVWKIKRVNISITEKYRTLQKIEEEKSTKKSVAEEYVVKKNTISTWIANKRKTFEAYEYGQVNSSREKLKKSDNEDLDKAVFTWFKNAR